MLDLKLWGALLGMLLATAASCGGETPDSGVLDPIEVDHTELRCNPAKPGAGPAPHVLVRTATELRGPSCDAAARARATSIRC
jgi:hypothetical protein